MFLSVMAYDVGIMKHAVNAIHRIRQVSNLTIDTLFIDILLLFIFSV